MALVNRGMNQSAGWEDLTEACAKKGMTKRQGIFWHKQSNEAFEPKTGILLDQLHLYWAGDAGRYRRRSDSARGPEQSSSQS